MSYSYRQDISIEKIKGSPTIKLIIFNYVFDNPPMVSGWLYKQSCKKLIGNLIKDLSNKCKFIFQGEMVVTMEQKLSFGTFKVILEDVDVMS